MAADYEVVFDRLRQSCLGQRGCAASPSWLYDPRPVTARLLGDKFTTPWILPACPEPPGVARSSPDLLGELVIPNTRAARCLSIVSKISGTYSQFLRPGDLFYWSLGGRFTAVIYDHTTPRLEALAVFDERARY